MKRLLDEHFRAWRETLATLAFFALMAIFVPAAKRAHLGTEGMFFAMIGSAALIAAVYYGGKLLRRRIAEDPISGKERVSYYTDGTLARGEEDLGGSALVVVDPATMQEIGVTRKLTEYDEAALDLVAEAEASLQNEELPDQIIEENPMYLADTFQPDIRTFLGAMALLVGMRRSGKSNAMAVIFEELARWLLPLLIFDTQDEHQGLVDKLYLRRGVHVGSADLLKESSSLKNYIPIDAEGAYAFGKTIMDGSLQVVVNLRSWDDETAARIMCEIIDGINDWQIGRHNTKRVPVMVGLDEAPKWLPQNLGESYVSKETQTLLHHAFFDLVVARGGKNGFGLVVAGQRYSQLNKNLLQSLWKFLFFQKEEVDLDRYAKLGIPRAAAMSLQQGECLIFSPTVLGFRAMLRCRHSPHLGHTPGLESLISHNSAMLPLPFVLNRSFVGETSTTIGPRIYGYQGGTESTDRGQVPQTAGYPYHQPKPQVAHQEEGRSGIVGGHQHAQTQLDRALQAWNEGHTSIRQMAAALTVTNDEAYRLLCKLDAKGLIVREKRVRS